MGATSISWTDNSWNPLRARDPKDGKSGWHCVRISPACKHCYASTFNGRRLPNGGTGLDYVATSPAESYLDEEVLKQPLKWRKPKRIFVGSMTDLFGDWVKDEWIDRMFAVMALCRQHTFQVLTKRADRMQASVSGLIAEIEAAKTGASAPRWDAARRWLHDALRKAGGVGNLKRAEYAGVMMAHQEFPLPNVWLGFSAENQEWFDRRAIELLPIMQGGWLVWVSAEPLLGRIRLSKYFGEKGIRWVVAGGESGPGARVCDFDWLRSIVRQCQDAKVPVFVKQLGKRPMGDWGPNPPTYHLSGMRNGVYQTTVELSQYKNGIWKLPDKKGGAINEFPEDLRVRQFPKLEAAR